MSKRIHYLNEPDLWMTALSKLRQYKAYEAEFLQIDASMTHAWLSGLVEELKDCEQDRFVRGELLHASKDQQAARKQCQSLLVLARYLQKKADEEAIALDLGLEAFGANQSRSLAHFLMAMERLANTCRQHTEQLAAIDAPAHFVNNVVAAHERLRDEMLRHTALKQARKQHTRRRNNAQNAVYKALRRIAEVAPLALASYPEEAAAFALPKKQGKVEIVDAESREVA